MPEDDMVSLRRNGDTVLLEIYRMIGEMSSSVKGIKDTTDEIKNEHRETKITLTEITNKLNDLEKAQGSAREERAAIKARVEEHIQTDRSIIDIAKDKVWNIAVFVVVSTAVTVAGIYIKDRLSPVVVNMLDNTFSQVQPVQSVQLAQPIPQLSHDLHSLPKEEALYNFKVDPRTGDIWKVPIDPSLGPAEKVTSVREGGVQ
jgi:hypothetical protein